MVVQIKTDLPTARSQLDDAATRFNIEANKENIVPIGPATRGVAGDLDNQRLVNIATQLDIRVEDAREKLRILGPSDVRYSGRDDPRDSLKRDIRRLNAMSSAIDSLQMADAALDSVDQPGMTGESRDKVISGADIDTGEALVQIDMVNIIRTEIR